MITCAASAPHLSRSWLRVGGCMEWLSPNHFNCNLSTSNCAAGRRRRSDGLRDQLLALYTPEGSRVGVSLETTNVIGRRTRTGAGGKGLEASSVIPSGRSILRPRIGTTSSDRASLWRWGLQLFSKIEGQSEHRSRNNLQLLRCLHWANRRSIEWRQALGPRGRNKNRDGTHADLAGYR